MQTLRNAHTIARLLLVWFALFIGASVASPLVSPQASQMVCSAMGMKMVPADEGSGDSATLSGRLDCPLCAQVTLPPVPMSGHLDGARALAYALRPVAAAHMAWLSGAPLPPRGPPAFA